MSDFLVRSLQQTGVLTDVEIEALRHVNSRERIVTARIDIDHDDFSDSIHLIMDGLACRYKIWAEGERRILSLLVPGDLCGGHATMPFIFHNKVAALTNCTIADIPRQTMAELIDRYPRIARALWWVTLAKLSTTQAWLANMGRPADKRMAHFFCEVLVRLQATDLADENSYDLGLTQFDLAEIFGLSNVHVNRVLKALKASGLMAVSNRRVTIFDVRRLKKLAEFDPGYLHDVASATMEGRPKSVQEPIARRRA